MSKNIKILVVIDMQNDFLTGSLANPEGVKIIPNVVKLINNFDGGIIATRDTHHESYDSTLEGQKLPVKHCIFHHSGWCIEDRVMTALEGKTYKNMSIIDKETFGYTYWYREIERWCYNPAEIHICGVCTDICVVSNALILRAVYPDVPMFCHANACAGVTREKHLAALEVMKSCQIDIVEE